MATTTKNEIWLNKALIKNNSKNLIRIVLSEKIDEKILSDVLIKLGLTRYGKKNSSYYEKCFYFVKHLSASAFGVSNTINLTRGSIIIDDKNSSIYIVGDESNFGIVEKKYCYINSNAGGLLSSMFSRISSISFYGDMAKLLINEKAIDREELYTKAGDLRQKHKMKEPDINNIIKEISVRFGQDGKYFEWIDDSVELILVKHFIKLIMDKYKEELVSNQINLEEKSIEPVPIESENNSKNNKEKVLDIEKLQSDILDKIKECEEKVKSVKDLIKDFDYSSKSDYEKSCSKIEEDLAKCSENPKDADIVNKVNEIIDEINQVYKNVYYKKNDISSLASYMGDEENIDLIERL